MATLVSSMHIFFSGIGGTAIGPLALIAKQAGYEVSGSDQKHSQYIEYLGKSGIDNISIGQSVDNIASLHGKTPIDWYVYSSALPADHPELDFCRKNNVKTSKRDELLNKIIADKNLKLFAVAGTHGKTTTTAMAIWLFKSLGIPVSYSVGAKIPFGEMGQYQPESEYFVYECDEFDRNFLAFNPYMSVISGIGYDHHEIFKSQEEYNQAFIEFINQSQSLIIWSEDAERLNLKITDNQLVIDEKNPEVNKISLLGLYNRRDAWLVVNGVHQLTKMPIGKLVELASKFPGISRRFESLAPNLYTDYAHTPEKILGAINVALEATKNTQQKIVVVYEPLTNRRMHYTKKQHEELFKSIDKLYWVPSYLAREDPSQKVLEPAELIKYLEPSSRSLAEPAKLDEKLKGNLDRHLAQGDLVLALSGGGGGSLDEWLRENFTK